MISNTMSEENHISVLTTNEGGKVVIITYDHYLKKINLSFRHDENEINIDLISDIEVSDKFGKVMDSFGFQDGDSNVISLNREIVKELIDLLFSKSRDFVIHS